MQGIFGYADAAGTDAGAADADRASAWLRRVPRCGALCARNRLAARRVLRRGGPRHRADRQRLSVGDPERSGSSRTSSRAETPYILHNLDFTRAGFGLDGSALERRPLRLDAASTPPWTGAEAAEQFAGLPVWGSEPLLRTTYRAGASTLPATTTSTGSPSTATAPGTGARCPSPSRRTADRALRDPAGGPELAEPAPARAVRRGHRAPSRALATGKSPRGGPEMLLLTPPEVATAARSRSMGLDLSLERPEVFFGTRASRDQPYAVVSPGVRTSTWRPDSTQGVPGGGFPRGDPPLGAGSARRFWPGTSGPRTCSSRPRSKPNRSRLVHRRRVIGSRRRRGALSALPRGAPYPVVSDGRVFCGFSRASPGTFWFPLASEQQLRDRPVPGPVRPQQREGHGRRRDGCPDLLPRADRRPARGRVRACVPGPLPTHRGDARRSARPPPLPAVRFSTSRAGSSWSITRRRPRPSTGSRTSGPSPRSARRARRSSRTKRNTASTACRARRRPASGSRRSFVPGGAREPDGDLGRRNRRCRVPARGALRRPGRRRGPRPEPDRGEHRSRIP